MFVNIWGPWHRLPTITSPLRDEHGVHGLRLEEANPSLQAGYGALASSLIMIECLKASDAPSEPRREGVWR